jgi:hypothetical protein
MPLSESEREWIEAQVDDAPPFTDEQRRRLARALWAVGR